MGVTLDIRRMEKQIITDYDGLHWIELGNQWDWLGRATKRWYVKRGVQHVSIDVNGRDGSVPLDLNHQIHLPTSDVLTNYGTLEHVKNQYAGWKNAHDLTRPNGIMIHAVMLADNHEGHSRYLYTHSFIAELILLMGYETLANEMLGKKGFKYVFLALRKDNRPFITEDKFPHRFIHDNGSEPQRDQEVKSFARPRRVINNIIYPMIKRLKWK